MSERVIMCIKKEDAFMEFIYSLGFTWLRYDIDRFKERTQEYITFIDNPEELEKYDPSIIYFIGAPLPKSVDPFGYHIFTKREEWPLFIDAFKAVTGKEFSFLLKKLE